MARLEGGLCNGQGVKEEGEHRRWEKRIAMVAEAVEERWLEIGMAAVLVSVGGRGRVGGWTELGW
jgi:hypothetical protein